MQTYGYRFTLKSNFESQDDVATFRDLLEAKLNNGPECLMAYCIFPTDSAILDDVQLTLNEKGNPEAVTLRTYTELWDSEGNDEDLKSCVEANVQEAASEVLDREGEYINVTGNMEVLGREGDIPKTLYYISTEKNYQKILKEGLIPSIGANNYKNTENRVYLTEERDLAPWLAILKHKDHPVILEVNTEGLNIETGRAFRDRDFVPGKTYGEYFSKEIVPASALKQVDLGRGSTDFDIALRGAMLDQVELATAKDEIAEVRTGLERLADMGLMLEESVDAIMEEHVSELLQEGRLREDSRNVGTSTAEYANEDEGLPWDENDAGRDLTQALEQMSLTDFEIKL